MTTPRLILMFAAWLHAAGAIAVTVGVVVTEILVLVGVVSRSGAGYGRSLGVPTAAVFVVLVLVPFLWRDRFGGSEEGERT